MVLDTKVIVGEEEREGGCDFGVEGERGDKLVYVHNPQKTVGEYSVQQPLLPSINLVSPHTHTHTHVAMEIYSN